jgi:hypothetical protein
VAGVVPVDAGSGSEQGRIPHEVFMKCNRKQSRRGVTSVLAMLYMILFATLAVGFVAMVDTTVQVSNNDKRTSTRLLAAESGMQYIRLHLWRLNLPATLNGQALFDAVYTQLSANLLSVAKVNDSLITIPASPTGFIDGGPAGQFRITIEKDGDRLRVRSYGKEGSGSAALRGIELRYAVAQRASAIFDFGVASKSPITLDSNAKIRGANDARLGSVLSTTLRTSTPVIMNGNAEVTGDVSLSNPNGNVQMDSNSTIAGYRRNQAGLANHIHVDVPEPEFPTVDTSMFKPFAGNPLYGGIIVNPPPPGGERKFASGTVRNPYIKANPDPNSWVVFDSNMTVEGVIYIETPNRVRFDSNVVVRGAIVVQNDPTGDTSRNSLEFRSNVKLHPIETLPASSYYPPEMRALTGAIILAPQFNVLFNSNFGAVGGSVIASKMEFDSNATGTIEGSVINLEDTSVHFDSNAAITIEARGTTQYPAGVKFGSRYVPLADTYLEVEQ